MGIDTAVTVTYTPPPEDNDNASAEALATPTYVVKKSLKFMEDDDTKGILDMSLIILFTYIISTKIYRIDFVFYSITL